MCNLQNSLIRFFMFFFLTNSWKSGVYSALRTQGHLHGLHSGCSAAPVASGLHCTLSPCLQAVPDPSSCSDSALPGLTPTQQASPHSQPCAVAAAGRPSQEHGVGHTPVQHCPMAPLPAPGPIPPDQCHCRLPPTLCLLESNSLLILHVPVGLLSPFPPNSVACPPPSTYRPLALSASPPLAVLTSLTDAARQLSVTAHPMAKAAAHSCAHAHFVLTQKKKKIYLY